MIFPKFEVIFSPKWWQFLEKFFLKKKCKFLTFWKLPVFETFYAVAIWRFWKWQISLGKKWKNFSQKNGFGGPGYCFRGKNGSKLRKNVPKMTPKWPLLTLLAIEKPFLRNFFQRRFLGPKMGQNEAKMGSKMAQNDPKMPPFEKIPQSQSHAKGILAPFWTLF